MQGQRPIYGVIIAGCILLIILILLLPGPGLRVLPDKGPPTVYLLYASAGSMSQLLNTNQIDAFIIWEPVVSNAELACIGKRIAVPADLPPPGKWVNTASCVLVLRNDVAKQYPDVSGLLSALTTAAINRTNEDPGLAKKITADWVFGNKPILAPEGSLNPLDVENLSFDNMVFTADADPPESGLVSQVQNDKTNYTYDPADMMNPVIQVRGEQFLNGSAVPVVTDDIPTLNIGYLPSSDNFAPLYVMVRDSPYFCDRYGFCLVPDDPTASRPVKCTLFVQGNPAANIKLIPAQSGGGIMTTIGQKALDGAYVGSVPAELQIVLGNPSSIIQSINTGGSGLVVGNQAPARDWNNFIHWVKSRSANGDPVVIATVQSSIQEDMIREALEYENIPVKLYGTDFETEYP
jgi:ABC-type nitrate/sulfonate/bicarbonate transport system substrate-binding protein